MVIVCFVFIWEQTATCATYIINWLVFITETKSVYYAVRNGFLNKAVCASSFYPSFRSRDSCRRLREPKHHSFLFNHWSASKCLVFMAARTPSIHVFLGRPLFLLSPGIHSIINFGSLSSCILLMWPYHWSLFLSMMSIMPGFSFTPIISFICTAFRGLAFGFLVFLVFFVF